MTRSKSREEDHARGQNAKGRVESTHGGETVEAIAPEELVRVNDPDCKHERMVRDSSETEFNAFKCDNPDCGIIALYDKE